MKYYLKYDKFKNNDKWQGIKFFYHDKTMKILLNEICGVAIRFKQTEIAFIVKINQPSIWKN